MTFHRPTTTEHNQLDAIANAYRTAGVEPPSPTTDALAAIAAELTAEQVAAELVREAYETGDATAWIEEALTRMARAQAADTLRKSLAVVGPRIQRTQINAVLEQTARDLAPAFDAIAKELTTAAHKLDPAGPLSLDNAVRDDTTKHYKAARSALSSLGAFAAIHEQGHVKDVPPVLLRVLPLLALPECAVEAVLPTAAIQVKAANEHELNGTRTVRALARALEDDTDTALIAVARGDYEGVTFALADRATLTERGATARRAHQRRSASADEARPSKVSVG